MTLSPRAYVIREKDIRERRSTLSTTCHGRNRAGVVVTYIIYCPRRGATEKGWYVVFHFWLLLEEMLELGF